MDRFKNVNDSIGHSIGDQRLIAVLQRLELEKGLRKALNQKEFQLYYQSLVNIKTEEIIGSEALLRWVHILRKD